MKIYLFFFNMQLVYLQYVKCKNDFFFSAAICKKEIRSDGHPKQIFGSSYFFRAEQLGYRMIW